MCTKEPSGWNLVSRVHLDCRHRRAQTMRPSTIPLRPIWEVFDAVMSDEDSGSVSDFVCNGYIPIPYPYSVVLLFLKDFLFCLWGNPVLITLQQPVPLAGPCGPLQCSWGESVWQSVWVLEGMEDNISRDRTPTEQKAINKSETVVTSQTSFIFSGASPTLCSFKRNSE